MNKQIQSLLIVLFFFPMVALAHGEEVLITIGVEFVSLVTFFVVLWNMQLKLITKLACIVLNFIGYYFIYVFTKGIPFRDSMLIISCLHTTVPLVILVAAYFSAKKFRKT